MGIKVTDEAGDILGAGGIVDLGPNDVLVIRLSGIYHFGGEALGNIENQLRAIFGERPVIIIDGNAVITVLRNGRVETAGNKGK